MEHIFTSARIYTKFTNGKQWTAVCTPPSHIVESLTLKCKYAFIWPLSWLSVAYTGFNFFFYTTEKLHFLTTRTFIRTYRPPLPPPSVTASLEILNILPATGVCLSRTRRTQTHTCMCVCVWYIIIYDVVRYSWKLLIFFFFCRKKYSWLENYATCVQIVCVVVDGVWQRTRGRKRDEILYDSAVCARKVQTFSGVSYDYIFFVYVRVCTEVFIYSFVDYKKKSKKNSFYTD